MTPKQKHDLDAFLNSYGYALIDGDPETITTWADQIDKIVSRMRERTDIHHQILFQMLSVCLDESATAGHVVATRDWLATMEAEDLAGLPDPRHWRTIS